MPLYEYQCEECGLRFERRQSFNDAPLSECPECEGPVHRVIGVTGVIFKGSGFYVTDNKKSGGRLTTSKNEESGETKTETKSEVKAETKAETKSEAAV